MDSNDIVDKIEPKKKLRSVDEKSSVKEPGGFLVRGAAYFIDAVVVSIVNWPVSFVLNIGIMMIVAGGDPEFTKSEEGASIQLIFTSLSYLVTMAISIFYYGWFYRNKGATPGKLLLGLRVASREDGTNIGYLKAFLREYIGKPIGFLFFAIGFLMCLFNEKKLCLHDYIAGTQVYKKQT